MELNTRSPVSGSLRDDNRSIGIRASLHANTQFFERTCIGQLPAKSPQPALQNPKSLFTITWHARDGATLSSPWCMPQEDETWGLESASNTARRFIVSLQTLAATTQRHRAL